jgi:hypothetical protein
MRESRTYGSVRGALSNERPYRDHIPDVPGVGLEWNEEAVAASQANL